MWLSSHWPEADIQKTQGQWNIIYDQERKHTEMQETDATNLVFHLGTNLVFRNVWVEACFAPPRWDSPMKSNKIDNKKKKGYS